MTLPDPETPLVYSLHYAKQGRQDGDVLWISLRLL